MTTQAERQRAIELWATEGATQDELIAALVAADKAARRWYAAQIVLDDGDIGRVEDTEGRLLADGAFDTRLPHDGASAP